MFQDRESKSSEAGLLATASGDSRKAREDTVGEKAETASGLHVRLGRPRIDGHCRKGSIPETPSFAEQKCVVHENISKQLVCVKSKGRAGKCVLRVFENCWER